VAASLTGINAALALLNPPDPPTVLSIRNYSSDTLQVDYAGTLGKTTSSSKPPP
jgi:hypothetical protein